MRFKPGFPLVRGHDGIRVSAGPEHNVFVLVEPTPRVGLHRGKSSGLGAKFRLGLWLGLRLGSM